MKNSTFIFLTVILAAAVSAGCLQGLTPGATPPVSPVQTPEVTQIPTIPVPKPSFSMSDHYLKKTYAFQSEEQIIVEEIRVDNASWGIGFDVLPLTDNVIYSWFEMNVTNTDSGHTDIYGYGRTNGFELKHLIPMYNTGPYKIEMRGNRVKVDVVVAKRNA